MTAAPELGAAVPFLGGTAVAFEVPQRDPCRFCENVAGRPVVSSSLAGAIVDCAVVDDMRETFAFIPPRQRASPHVLVIPKRHAATILDLAAEEAAAIMRHVHRVAAADTRAFEPARRRCRIR